MRSLPSRLSGTGERNSVDAVFCQAITSEKSSEVSDQPCEPQILEAEWEPDQILLLLADLQRGSETGQVQIEHVQLRTRDGQSNVHDQSATIADAEISFRDGTAKAIQLRYRFDGEAWCDTLMVGPQTTRVIRTRAT